MNADDFGLTAGVNRAIIELHLAGVLTSTTLMARTGATEAQLHWPEKHRRSEPAATLCWPTANRFCLPVGFPP